ncbi:MAG: cobalamin biosynthesis protein [Eubacteriaceae bacterium]|nr:cobalamin biosynthesis protein [Eubacteriaceae bacterium]
MNIAVFAYSKKGCETAKRVMELLPDDSVSAYAASRLKEDGFGTIPHNSKEFYGEWFSWADAMIFVGACGIAVREIAPHVRDKRTDPAVIDIDELARFVIPILSGHIGGANDLAYRIATALGSTPVITTATDINAKFAVDSWAVKCGYKIGNMTAAKMVSARILETDIPITSDFPIAGNLPNGLVLGESGDIGIYVGYKDKKPFKMTLSIFPQIMHLGIGCRRDISHTAVEEAVMAVMEANGLDMRAVKSVSSIDIKADEQGLITFCQKNTLPFVCYSAEDLMTVQGDFSRSEFVESVTGVDNVCERSALMGADELIVKKTALNGVTVAAAIEKTEVKFG